MKLIATTVIISTGKHSPNLAELSDGRQIQRTRSERLRHLRTAFSTGQESGCCGGGDTAFEEALYLSNIAAKVVHDCAQSFLRASKVIASPAVFEKENIEVLFNTVTSAAFFGKRLEAPHFTNSWAPTSKRTYSLPVDGFFLASVHTPNTDLFKGTGLPLTESRYIITKPIHSLTKCALGICSGDVADPRLPSGLSPQPEALQAHIDAEALPHRTGLTPATEHTISGGRDSF